MKHAILTVFLTGLILSGCVPHAQLTDSAPQEHRLNITVDSTNDSQVSINEDQTADPYAKGTSPEIKLSTLSSVCFKNKVAFIKIFSGISVSDVQRAWNDFIFFEHMTDIRDVHIFINSPGGDAFSGLALADQIERAKANGFNVTAHASGIIASAAVPIFAVCNQRFAAPGTIFMVHEAALWKWPGRETASDIRSQNELMDLLRGRYIDKMVANSNLNKSQWEELEKKTTWFCVEKAKEWGLVDQIK